MIRGRILKWRGICGNVRYNTHLYGGRVLASDGRGPRFDPRLGQKVLSIFSPVKVRVTTARKVINTVYTIYVHILEVVTIARYFGSISPAAYPRTLT